MQSILLLFKNKQLGSNLIRLISILSLLVMIGMIPWTIYLAITLPGHFHAHNWRLAWVGFDIVLIIMLGFTAWAAWRGRQVLILASIVMSTLLLCDAWFDISTSFNTSSQGLAIFTALIGNFPASIFFGFLARRMVLNTAITIAKMTNQKSYPEKLRDIRLMISSKA